MGEHLSANARIVHNKAFENGIIKLQAPSGPALNSAEKEACKVFLIRVVENEDGTEREEIYAQRILREAEEERLRKKPRVAEYGSVKHVCNIYSIYLC